MAPFKIAEEQPVYFTWESFQGPNESVRGYLTYHLGVKRVCFSTLHYGINMAEIHNMAF